MSRDGGQSWTDVVAGFPGLPEMALVNGIEASRHVEGRVYTVWNNYRNDDYGNYLYVSDDYGSSWTRLDGALPAERVLRTVREDLRNPDVLYLGAEIGLYWSMDRGRSWTELRAGMPTLAFNDLVIHPRDNDLVLATHGRGVWIIDQINALQEMSSEVAASPVHLFTMEPAAQIRRRNEGAHTGDVYYRGANPPVGAMVDYWLGSNADSGSVQITVSGPDGGHVATLEGPTRAGLNRVVWNLRHELQGGSGGGFFGGGLAPWVVPGTYQVTVTAPGGTSGRTVEVREDPRIRATPGVRRAWTETLLELAALRRAARAEGERFEALVEAADEAEEEAPEVRDLDREWGELASRIQRLMGDVMGSVAPLTQDQRSRMDHYQEMAATLARESEAHR